MAVVNNIEESLIIANRNILRMFELREYEVDMTIDYTILTQSNVGRFVHNYMFDSPSRNITTFVYVYKLADILPVTMQKKDIEQCFNTFIEDKKRHMESTSLHRKYTLMLIVGKTNTKKMNHIKKNVRIVKKREHIQFEVFNGTFFSLFPPDHYLNPEFTIFRQVEDVDSFLQAYHMNGRVCPMIYTDDVMSRLYDAHLGDYFLVKRPSRSAGTGLMIRKLVLNPKSKY